MEFEPSAAALDEHFVRKYGAVSESGWGPRMRRRFGYYTPDDYYEILVASLVTPGCRWLDVGSGRNVFPSNRPLAKLLAERAGGFVGVDPDETIHENDIVHERVRSTIEDYQSSRPFDVVTLRMVAEHMTDPDAAGKSFARLLRLGGRVVIYTVNKWAPASIASSVVPFRLHHVAKKALWGTEEKDTFPVVYRMNTRRALASTLGACGLVEVGFRYLDDCRSTNNFRALQFIELSIRTMLHAVKLRYPENCLLGVYERR